MKYKYKMKRKRRRLFATSKRINISRHRATPFYVGWESKRGGPTKLETVSGGRVGGGFFEGKSGRGRDNKGDYWQREPIRKKGGAIVKKLVPRLQRSRRKSPVDYKLSTPLRGEVQMSTSAKQEKVKLIPMRGQMVTKKTQVKRPPDKVAASMTNAANKFHKDGVKTSSRGYAGSTKPALTSSGVNPLEPMSLERKSIRTSMSNNAFEKRSIHHMKFKTGFKPTNPVFRLAKDNGTKYDVIVDSKMSWQNDTRRQFLNHACGFNSRAFIIPPRSSFITVGDVVDYIFQLNTTTADASPVYVTGSRYGALMSVTSQFMIHNQSAYMPCKLIAHLCQFTNPQEMEGIDVSEFFRSNVFNEVTTVQDDGCIPRFYQHGDVVIEQETTNGFTRTVHCDISYKGKGLYDSTRFRNSVSVIKSESVRLEAGDFLNLTHTHECGPGVDLGKLHDTYDRGNLQEAPFSFFVVFELQGYECEGLYKSAADLNTFIGKSPAYISYEFKKSYLGAREASVSNLTSIPVVGKIAIRDFASRSVDIAGSLRERFVLPENIVGSVPTVTGTLSVTVSSDKTRVTHTTATSDQGTEANP